MLFWVAQLKRTTATVTDSGKMKMRDGGKLAFSVPFHRRMSSTGPCDYTGVTFHHRSLVDVLKERISDLHTALKFHMEPYKLLWQPTDLHHQEHLHGEIFTLDAFHEAHNLLQDCPGEPGCDLQQVVIALMFWSDATHLTSFGTAHLWLCYLFLGNELKY